MEKTAQCPCLCWPKSRVGKRNTELLGGGLWFFDHGCSREEVEGGPSLALGASCAASLERGASTDCLAAATRRAVKLALAGSGYMECSQVQLAS